LPWKTAALIAGIALILLGDRLGARWLVWVAIGVLAVAVVLRFLPKDSSNGDSEPHG
jgi:drug/metabolite transporter (DMT)-like permease